MATTDARPVPIKNTAFRATFGIYKNDGTLITGATALDSEVSKDGGAFADCTNEATEIAQGVYYLDLTSTEMNADTVTVIVKTTSTGAVPPVLTFYPQEADDIKVSVTHNAGSAITATGGRQEVNVSHFGGTAGTFASGRPEVNATHIDGAAATNLRHSLSTMQVVTVSTGSTSTSITTQNLSGVEATNDHYKGKALYFLTGNLAKQIVEITAYNGTTGTLTVTATPSGESPANNDTALIV